MFLFRIIRSWVVYISKQETEKVLERAAAKWIACVCTAFVVSFSGPRTFCVPFLLGGELLLLRGVTNAGMSIYHNHLPAPHAISLSLSPSLSLLLLFSLSLSSFALIKPKGPELLPPSVYSGSRKLHSPFFFAPVLPRFPSFVCVVLCFSVLLLLSRRLPIDGPTTLSSSKRKITLSLSHSSRVLSFFINRALLSLYRYY